MGSITMLFFRLLWADMKDQSGQADEWAKLQEVALKAQRRRKKGPQELGTQLVAVWPDLALRRKITPHQSA